MEWNAKLLKIKGYCYQDEIIFRFKQFHYDATYTLLYFLSQQQIFLKQSFLFQFIIPLDTLFILIID